MSAPKAVVQVPHAGPAGIYHEGHQGRGRQQYPQLRQSQLRLVITTVEITSKLRRFYGTIPDKKAWRPDQARVGLGRAVWYGRGLYEFE